MSGGLCSDEEIVWEYIDQQESEFLYHEIFVNKAYFNGITLNEGNIIVDAGANIGLFSLYCLSRVKNLKVCAFEPIKPIFDVLQRNLSSYFKNERKGDLKLFNAALGARNEGNQMFYYFPSAPGESTRHIIERNHQKYKIEQLIRISPDPIVHELFPQSAQKHKRKLSEMQPPEVGSRMFGDAETCYSDIITLPTAMRQAFGDDWAIDLLKIDVEGDEWNILLGLLSNEDEVSLPSSLLQGSSSPNMPYICRVRQIVLEVHDQCLETRSILSHRCGRLDHIVEFLQYYGFTVSVEQQLSRVCTGTDYYMYIPSELNLYYVYAVHNTFHELNIHQDPSPLNTILTTSTSTPKDESNSPHVSNSDTQLTSEDFETLLAVLEDNKSIERGNQTPNELNK